ncbi:hypothetical protein A3H80_03275 [Candidatus Roizmanbacteria bacterium RIFCSPLOWO2_02_FULL_37_19]|uniref:AI-2E family transporter n=1 Tax=Candidatus Roizmanbacteria bacterium RIFCSPHIGHO2_02_FULL_37_24 TaxID=1802037 RepID=A0A1F7GWE0_9BACT|nr:MAG: hypothetical protein A2862_03595 [Candidatus Roizmanbacteria bacterium RIFCSPHIGHO2_01_FULL_38_41]OGK23084.1 MAG: hypothetical protein A3C24_04730 [Candidatus Roizmanbacteria bacterium RIFCSPHIGHO2_02_FULL_37_24]OGK33875.1 MAG: hypothetical protein A3E10_01775 [Candidatus Roizmanbacteria bacterium RIFCSPHIGHO2_12_FULL_37_23]OGK45700.1 MAG: hypothetical protein A2956_01850 [Candidatus Roizmanbacteria bacterium RIFCSPLOWO2_01_FULL_37_57]OGK54111.1 MAG: hypothetical protein A3H80_03275 [Ca
MTQKIEISSRTIIFTILFILALRAIWLIRELLFALFLAFIFMSALKPIVNKIEARGVNRSLSAVVVFLLTLLVIIFMLGTILPPILSESILFIKNLPFLLVETFPFLSEYLSLESAVQFLPNITENFFRVASGVFSNFIFVISVLFFTFYFLLEKNFLESFIKKFLKKEQAQKIISITQKIELRMGAWMRGELILMTIIGVFTYIALNILGIKFALSLAFIAGLLEIIPIIGPIIAAIPAFLVASSDSFFLGGIVIILYIIIQQLENNLIVPFVMNKAVGIHPITILIALSIGGRLGGLLGAVLAVPVALFIETIVTQLLSRNVSPTSKVD